MHHAGVAVHPHYSVVGCGSSPCFQHVVTVVVALKGAVYTVWIFIYSCMFLELFLFAKKMKFLTKGGIHCISRSSLGTLFYARALIGRTDGA